MNFLVIANIRPHFTMTPGSLRQSVAKPAFLEFPAIPEARAMTIAGEPEVVAKVIHGPSAIQLGFVNILLVFLKKFATVCHCALVCFVRQVVGRKLAVQRVTVIVPQIGPYHAREIACQELVKLAGCDGAAFRVTRGRGHRSVSLVMTRPLTASHVSGGSPVERWSFQLVWEGVSTSDR
ncbi:MAG: hypothetical protein R3D03_10220 [Geminicoccaceae bacterium]